MPCPTARHSQLVGTNAPATGFLVPGGQGLQAELWEAPVEGLVVPAGLQGSGRSRGPQPSAAGVQAAFELQAGARIAPPARQSAPHQQTMCIAYQDWQEKVRVSLLQVPCGLHGTVADNPVRLISCPCSVK